MSKLHILKNGISFQEITLESSKEYIIGRSSDCDIMLDAEGISRHHAKLVFEQGSWALEKMSKYGVLLRGDVDISHHTLNADDGFSIPPYQFKFSADSQLVPAAHVSTERLDDETQEFNTEEPEAREFDEVTSIGEMRALPFITVNDDSFRLEGQSWIVGRDENCEIVIQEPRSSRKHLKISKAGNEYTVQDLGSSNGTLLNGKQLLDKAEPLDSGDVLKIGDTQIVFEIKDPLMTRELEHMPVSATSGAQMVYVPININTNSNLPDSAASVIRLEKQKAALNKPANIKRIIMVLAVFGLLAFLMSEEDKGKKDLASKAKDAKAVSKDPFDLLTPQEQEQVRRTYNLAQNLFMQTKYELALIEIRKVHEKVPQYLKSKEIETLADSALQAIKNRQYEEDIEKNKKDAEARAKSIIDDCKKRFAKSDSVESIESCLAPGLEIDPENATAAELVDSARARIAQRELEQQNRAEYGRKVKAREAIYFKAKALHEKGQLIDALEVYNRHIASTLPDPKGLESKSKAGVDAIKSDVKQTMDQAIRESESHYTNAEYKEAIVKLDKALELDPNNNKARELYQNSNKELTKKLKAIFSESVVEESLGNIESAKSKWKKILDADVPRGEYRQKAQIKLKKYGE